MIDVVEPFLGVWVDRFESVNKPFGDLAQEDAALACGVEKLGVGIAPQVLRKHVKYLVSNLRRRKHLVVAQVCDATQDVGVASLLK